MIGTLFATLLVKIAVSGGCQGGQIEMDMECKTHEKVEREYYYGELGNSRTIRFLTGDGDPCIAPIISGSMAYLEFDVYWRQKHAVSLLSLPFFSNFVKLIKYALENSKEESLVFPVRKWSDSTAENKEIGIGAIWTWSVYDQNLSSLLLSMSSLCTDLAIVKPDADSGNNNLSYRVESTIPVAGSIPHPRVKDFVFKFP